MSTINHHHPRRFSRTFARIIAILAVALGLLAILSGFGSRWGFWSFRTGFTLLGIAAYGGIALAVLAILGLLLSFKQGNRPSQMAAAFALGVSIVLIFVPLQWRMRAHRAPPIHDVSTDTENPPQFVAVIPLRNSTSNSLVYGGPTVAAEQRAAYPDIGPRLLELPPDRAFQRALDTAHEMGWTIVAVDPSAGHIEATDQTFWFGFRDDIVVRITPADSRSVVDVRSVSRVGINDAGTNARRVEEYLKRLGTG